MTRQVIETGNSFVLIAGGVPARTATPTLVSRTTTSLTLSVTRGGGGIATLYRWRYSTNSTVSDSDPKVTSSGPNITIRGLSPGTSYWIDVRAENSSGNSDYSGNLATATTGSAPIDPPTPTITTDTDSIWCYESSDESDPPSGGSTTRLHTPSGCSRSSLSAHATSWVYKYTRTRTYTNGTFTSATAWGSGTRVHSPTGSGPIDPPIDPPTPTTTVSANAGSDKSIVGGGGRVRIGGNDTITNGVGRTTRNWARVSGAYGINFAGGSSATSNRPYMLATAGSAQRTAVWRKTVTNNGVSDTDDVTITVTYTPTTQATVGGQKPREMAPIDLPSV